MSTLVRAVIAYFFLMAVMPILGRRTAAEATPFEFVLMILVGGIGIRAVLGADPSMVNAGSAVATIALLHALVVWAKERRSRARAPRPSP